MRDFLPKLVPSPFCDTLDRDKKSRRTFEEHYAWVLNQIRILGVDTEELTFDDLEDVCQELVDQGTFFNFRTWQGRKMEIVQRDGKWWCISGNTTIGGPYKDRDMAKVNHPFADQDPRVTHEWNGRCEPPGELVNGVVDDSPPISSGREDKGGDSEGKGEDGGTFDEFEDLDSLVNAAEDGSEKASDRLTQLAVAAGWSEETVGEASTWGDVKEMIENPQDKEGEGEGDEDEEGEEDEASEPEKGQLTSSSLLVGEGNGCVR